MLKWMLDQEAFEIVKNSDMIANTEEAIKNMVLICKVSIPEVLKAKNALK